MARIVSTSVSSRHEALGKYSAMECHGGLQTALMTTMLINRKSRIFSGLTGQDSPIPTPELF